MKDLRSPFFFLEITMINEHNRIVDFSKCKECKYWQGGKEDNYDSPCPDCLDIPVNEATDTPVFFEKR